jgi:hypothetical protein
MSKELKYPQLKEILKKLPLDEFMKKNVSKIPKNIPEDVKNKLLEDAKFFSELGITTDDPEVFDSLTKKHKKAYPNYDDYMYIQPPRDTQKWLQAVKDMYYRIHKGASDTDALNQVISGWSDMEKLDFKNWLKFYEEGAHKKYAQVNYWEDANRAGYFVPVYPEPVKTPINNVQDIEYAKDPNTHPTLSNEEKRRIIEKQRQKIIGRLDSAEKLLRSEEGQTFAGKEFETLLEAIYQLKKKIQMVNKISLSTKLYEDMIVRESNILIRQGFVKAGNLLSKVAQGMPAPAEPPNPVANVGIPGNIPGEGPGLTPPGAGPTDTAAPADPSGQSAPVEPPKPEAVSNGMRSFLEGLDTSNDTFDPDDKEELEVLDNDDIVVSAQAVESPNIEVSEDQVSEDQIKNDPGIKADKDFDKIIDSAFDGLTMQDVVNKLEDISKVFKVREIPRQLAMVDLMLDRLGLASLFPTLSEAINKSLEANQYVSTRIEDILSRLRGTLQTKDLDLMGNSPTTNSPGIQSAKEKIESDLEKEKTRKQMRKNLENQELTNQEKPKPEIEVQEDLAQPTALKGAPPPAVAPPTPPPPIPR